jgi:hypothetical protein
MEEVRRNVAHRHEVLLYFFLAIFRTNQNEQGKRSCSMAFEMWPLRLAKMGIDVSLLSHFDSFVLMQELITIQIITLLHKLNKSDTLTLLRYLVLHFVPLQMDVQHYPEPRPCLLPYPETFACTHRLSW